MELIRRLTIVTLINYCCGKALLNTSHLSYYRSILVDTDTNNLIIGGMNSVTIIDLASTDESTVNSTTLSIPPQTLDKDYCVLSRPDKPYCQNHIRLISKKKSSDILIMCGTNADAPKGYELNLATLTQPVMIGTCFSSGDPFDNFTAIYSLSADSTSNDHIYFGATYSGDSSISRQVYDGSLKDDVKGVISNIWMKKPQFTGSFDIDDDQVFFFFRELAVEVDPAEPRLYSRVAKVCKQDVGGNSLLRSKWTSYQKARLNCSIPGEFPIYFDEIQDIVSKDNIIFYGLFTTSGHLPASAICAFHKSDIQSVLKGQFKQQSTNNSYWTEATTVPSPRPGQCTNDTLSVPNEVLQFIVDHPLMHLSVQSMYGRPIFILKDEELQKLEIHRNMTELVFYAGSNRGNIYKLFSKNTKTYTSNIFSTGESPIWSLKQSSNSVFVGTDTNVIKINVVTCDQYMCLESCIKDPHCAWINNTDFSEDKDISKVGQCHNGCISLANVSEYCILNSSYTHHDVDLSNPVQNWCQPSIKEQKTTTSETGQSSNTEPVTTPSESGQSSTTEQETTTSVSCQSSTTELGTTPLESGSPLNTDLATTLSETVGQESSTGRMTALSILDTTWGRAAIYVFIIIGALYALDFLVVCIYYVYNFNERRSCLDNNEKLLVVTNVVVVYLLLGAVFLIMGFTSSGEFVRVILVSIVFVIVKALDCFIFCKAYFLKEKPDDAEKKGNEKNEIGEEIPDLDHIEKRDDAEKNGNDKRENKENENVFTVLIWILEIRFFIWTIITAVKMVYYIYEFFMCRTFSRRKDKKCNIEENANKEC